MKRALYAGTFDPFTNGHLDIATRAIEIFDELSIVIATPPNKTPYIPIAERSSAIECIFKKEKRIKIFQWSGLVVDFAKKQGISHIVRGLRPTGDFEMEFQMASMNRKLLNSIDTVFLITSENQYFISSSLIKEIHGHGGDVSPFVPDEIFKILKNLKKS